MMVDATLVNMQPEIGLTWQRYPSVENIQRTLKMDRRQAQWLHQVCRVDGDMRLSIMMINDLARMMKTVGHPVAFMVVQGKVVNLPVEWKRNPRENGSA